MIELIALAGWTLIIGTAMTGLYLIAMAALNKVAEVFVDRRHKQ